VATVVSSTDIENPGFSEATPNANATATAEDKPKAKGNAKNFTLFFE